MARSRERRARRMDALAVGLILLLTMLLGFVTLVVIR